MVDYYEQGCHLQWGSYIDLSSKCIPLTSKHLCEHVQEVVKLF